MNIEDTKPIDVLASRMWSGTHWCYPNIKKMVAELTTLRAQVAGLEERYNELLFAVGNKYEGETRHQTALRYIRERESASSDAASAVKEPA